MPDDVNRQTTQIDPGKLSLSRWDNEGGSPEGGHADHLKDPAQLAELMADVEANEVEDRMSGSASANSVK
jgi:hypothetical protein